MPEREHHADTTRAEGAEQDTTGVTVAEAAAALGVTDRAIRARLRRGTLPGHQVQGARGLEWRVLGIPSHGTSQAESEPEPSGPEWEQERAALLDQVAWLRGHVDELTRQLDEERHERRALSARHTVSLPPPPPETPPPATQGRPWWRFWG